MARLRGKYRKDEKGRKALQYYYAEFYDGHRHPRQKRVSLGTRDKQAARQKLVEMEREYMAGLWDPWHDALQGEGMLIGKAIQAFLKSREGRSPKTIANYENILRIFRESLPPGMMLAAVETRHVNAFLDGRNLKERSRHTYTRHLGVFFRWCMADGLCKHDPTPVNGRLRRRPRRTVPEFLTEAQVEELLCTIKADAVLKHAITDGNRWLTHVIRFTLGTSLHRGEMCNLRWSAVDLHTGLITVRNTEDFETKSGHERAVPLVGDARAVIVALRETRTSEADDYVFKGMRGDQLNAEHLSRRFRFYRRLARLPKGINFHSLRHTFASWWVMRGGDLYRLKEVLGHADIQTTMIYAHLRPDALLEEMEKCFGHGRIARKEDVAELRERLESLRSENRYLRERLGQERVDDGVLIPVGHT